MSYINNKPKAFVIFLYSLIALSLFLVSTIFATGICKDCYGLIVGIALMIIAIPFHCAGKKRKAFYLFAFLINSIANGFSVSSFYISKNIYLNFFELLLALIPASAILLLVYFMLQIFNKTKKITITLATIINLILTITLLVLWIMEDSLFYSFGFFGTLISIFYLCVFGISINHDERSVLRDISFGSFGAFIIISVVIIFILSEGEILDGLDFGAGNDGKAKKKK